MRCAVLNCNNNNETKRRRRWRLYSFPKEGILAKKWVAFCRWDGMIDTKTQGICEAHFTANDFERNLQFEWGFMTKNPRKLKPGSFPSIYPNAAAETLSKYEKIVSKPKEETVIKTEPNESDEESEFISNNPKRLELGSFPNAATDTLAAEKTSSYIESQTYKKIRKPEKQIVINTETKACGEEIGTRPPSKGVDVEFLKCQSLMRIEMKSLRKESNALKKVIQQQEREKAQLQRSLRKIEFEQSSMEARLSRLFTSGQLKKLKTGEKRRVWTKDDITQSMALYTTSSKAYQMLQRRGFPLPAIRTMQRIQQLKKMEHTMPTCEPQVVIKSEEQFDETAAEFEGTP